MRYEDWIRYENARKAARAAAQSGVQARRKSTGRLVAVVRIFRRAMKPSKRSIQRISV